MPQQKNCFYLPGITVILIFLAFLVCFSGCSPSLPRINPPGKKDTSQVQKQCRQAFPHGEWRFIHSIQVNISDKKRMSLMGISQVESETNSLHCILMTIEGMVIFEAKYEDHNTTIIRSVPPFDSSRFAKRLMQDVKFIFLFPEGKCIDTGLIDNSHYICRYAIDKSHINDIQVHKNKKKWSLHQYKHGKKVRTLQAKTNNSSQEQSRRVHPEKLIFKAYNPSNNYTLKMDLIKAKNLSKD